jgi:two-component system response regulator HydG
MPDTLFEAELFGHTKGAFTDAKTDRVGLFERANGGTLFLDEIGELRLSMQPKLLRVLQDRVVRPVGSTREIPLDVRVIAASNRDLHSSMRAGEFREDLFYRINVIEISVPPLRERGRDVLLCAQHFIHEFASQMHKNVEGLSLPAAERLLTYSWPGNVRELRNTIERAVALTRHTRIVIDDLPEQLREHRAKSPEPATATEELVPLEEIERRYIARVMEATGGNKKLAAQILGVDRSTLYRKQDRYRETTGDDVRPNSERGSERTSERLSDRSSERKQPIASSLPPPQGEKTPPIE